VLIDNFSGDFLDQFVVVWQRAVSRAVKGN